MGLCLLYGKVHCILERFKKCPGYGVKSGSSSHPRLRLLPQRLLVSVHMSVYVCVCVWWEQGGGRFLFQNSHRYSHPVPCGAPDCTQHRRVPLFSCTPAVSAATFLVAATRVPGCSCQHPPNLPLLMDFWGVSRLTLLTCCQERPLILALRACVGTS